MNAKLTIFVFYIFFNGFFGCYSIAQEEPVSPQGRLARSAGAYLGSLEYARVFKASDCGYALLKKYPSISEALSDEVMPSFSSVIQKEIFKGFKSFEPLLKSQAKENVDLIIANLKLESDRNTACGKASALIATIVGQAKDNWIKNKNLYGRKN